MVKVSIKASLFTSSQAGPASSLLCCATFKSSSNAFHQTHSVFQERHCSAEARTAMASDRDTLPTSIKPSNYNLSLSNLQFGGSWAYDGLVKIQSKVNSSTSQIVLNAKFIEIKQVDVLQNDSSVASLKDVSYDEKNERATINLSKELSTGEAVLAIKFQGTMNDAMEGFYRAKYKPAETPAAGTPFDGTHHYMFSTQFEACTARRAFPCFDEPNLKASFEFDVEIPEDLVAISNMPVKDTSKGSKSGLKKVSFEKSPTMSTYVRLPSITGSKLLTGHSLQHGLLETSSMSRHSQNGSTVARASRSVFTLLEVSKSKAILHLNMLTRPLTISPRLLESTIPFPRLIC